MWILILWFEFLFLLFISSSIFGKFFICLVFNFLISNSIYIIGLLCGSDKIMFINI